MKRYVCIHCHFYQPPRENPWIERIEYQESAYPFHDWNERITAECYAPNALSRVLDQEQWVVSLVNNYSKISFNFGPTLLAWLEDCKPEIYQAILDGDRDSQKRFSGHGSAIAQAYNHAILPLANRRDKETQVIWGLRDFEKRFARQPEAMWLPETAVDTETLEILAAHGMKYVILAPRQAKSVRPLNGKEWKDVPDEAVDPTKPYLVHLPGGKSIAAFFYDGPISRGVAFEGLLHNGETFARRIYQAFNGEKDGKDVQLAHIATDGETYGHHHRHGEMALSYALNFIESDADVALTNYGEFLAKHPPKMEAQIREKSSWSCAHGVGRWQDDCGCNTGGHPGWHQKWRKPLRSALDRLRDRLTEPYEKEVGRLGIDPWRSRDAYIELILDRSDERRQTFLHDLAPGLPEEDAVRLLQALEMQRQLLLMYTSCAWFFDEISGIETVQTLKYAYRAIQLGEDLFGAPLSPDFAHHLAEAPSNLPSAPTGKDILERYVKPSEVDFKRLTAHQAALLVVEADSAEIASLSASHDIEVLECQKRSAGRARLAVGRLRIRSRVTTESQTVAFMAVHFGDQNMNIGVAADLPEDSYRHTRREAIIAIEKADLPATIRIVDAGFKSGRVLALKELLYDGQRRVLGEVMRDSQQEIYGVLKNAYQNAYPLIAFLADSGQAIPSIYRSVSEFVKNRGIRHALETDPPDFAQIKTDLENARAWQLNLDEAGIGLFWRDRVEELMDLYEKNPGDREHAASLLQLIELARAAGLAVDLWHAQNRFYLWRKSLLPLLAEPERREVFHKLGRELKVRTGL